MEELFLPVLESAIVIAGHYAHACGRDTMLPEDACYGLMFAARHVAGKQIGSLFPEMYDGEDDEDEVEVVEEPQEWTRYTGDDANMVLVNKCADEWDDWEPETPLEHALKNAVEKAKESYGGA